MSELGSISRSLRTVLNERRPETTTLRRMDVIAGVAVALVAVLELWFRQDLDLVGWSALMVAAPAITYRRVFPLGALGAFFLACASVDIYQLVTHTGVQDMATSAFFLALPYSLCRWGSGKEMLGGLAFAAAAFALGASADDLSFSETIGGIAVFAVAYVLGLTQRLLAKHRAHRILHARSLERERIARDLHDTVAHHVSAIAIRAQAGLALAESDQSATVDALRVIANEASKTLDEMRTMVGSLRGDEQVEYHPHSVDAFASLASDDVAPPVKLEVRGEVEAVSGAVGGALFRIAQEAVTNARRHSRDCTRIDVLFEVRGKSARLEVSNDGHPASRSQVGYGLIGMEERTKLLGGTLEAGPIDGGGWRVIAVIPKRGPAS